MQILEEQGGEVVVVPLLDSETRTPSALVKARFALRALGPLRRIAGQRGATILVFHPAVASVGGLAWMVAGPRTVSLRIFCHGTDAWSLGPVARWCIRRSGAQLFAVSNFTAGSLVAVANARLLPPILSPDWYERLAGKGEAARSEGERSQLLTVFRLDDAERKGAELLLAALDRVRARYPASRLVIAGHGPAPGWLRQQVAARTWARLVEDPTSEELAGLYRTSGLFVLASRTNPATATGEGFGIVLAEAQVAGLPVVGPAFGGSADAMVTDVTGMRPVDESVDALAGVLRWCFDHPAALDRMAENAAVWARARFAPERARAQVLAALSLNGGAPPMPVRLDRVASGEEASPEGAVEPPSPRPDADLEAVRSTWQALGDIDPLWAVLSRPDKAGNRWEAAEFFATGVDEVARLMDRITALGIRLRTARALDFGCGVGRLTQALAAHFDAVDGVDISDSMIARAREYNATGDRCAYHLNARPDLSAFPDDSYDLVYSNITLQHMPRERAEAYIAELLRVAHGDGVVAFQLPSRQKPMPLLLRTKVWAASRSSVRRLLGAVPGSSAPMALMNTIPRDAMCDLLEGLGATVLAVDPDDGGGDWYESYRYYVRPKGTAPGTAD
ncbi:MAG: glycosyltransferase [Acidimicrobiales bacterium]